MNINQTVMTHNGLGTIIGIEDDYAWVRRTWTNEHGKEITSTGYYAISDLRSV